MEINFKFKDKYFHQSQDFIEFLFMSIHMDKRKDKIGFVVATTSCNDKYLYENLRPVLNIEGEDLKVDRGYYIKESFLKIINDIGIRNITDIYYIPHTNKKQIKIEYSNYEKGF